MKVLIIEDDWIIAQDIDEIVRSMEFETQIAHSYISACETYRGFVPDLILSDINLGEGEKTGIDFVNQIMKDDKKAEVIFITAHNDSSTLSEVEESTPLNFLVKPYNEEQLKTSLILAKNYIAKKNVKPEGLDLLTHKELKIIELIAKNKTSKEIADELFLSDKTVRNHRYNISKKLDLSGENNSLLSWAVKNLS